MARGMTPDQTTGLAQRLSQTIDWLKLFRRALGYYARYQGDIAQCRQTLEGCAEFAVRYTRFWGPMVFVLRPGGEKTPEGFTLPPATETELQPYTFFPLFREGIGELRLMPGIGVEELELLLRTAADRTRRATEDPYVALWLSERPGLQFELAPTLTPHIAASLADRQSSDAHLQAYLRILEAAGPFDPGVESRASFTSDLAAGLVDQGLDPGRARAVLAAFDPVGALTEVSTQARANLRAFFAHAPDREARVTAIRDRHFRGAQ